MLEMRKLQKLGKVELLELVRELTEELEEVRFKNDMLVRTAPPQGQSQSQPPLETNPVQQAAAPPYEPEASAEEPMSRQMAYARPKEMDPVIMSLDMEEQMRTQAQAHAEAAPEAQAPDPQPQVQARHAAWHPQTAYSPPEEAAQEAPEPQRTETTSSEAEQPPEAAQELTQALWEAPAEQEPEPPLEEPEPVWIPPEETPPLVQARRETETKHEDEQDEEIILGQLEHFTQSVQEICEIALRTRQDMETCMASVQQSIRQRDEEAKQMAQMVDLAMGKSEAVMKALLDYKAVTEGTLERLVDSVTNLQRVIQ